MSNCIVYPESSVRDVYELKTDYPKSEMSTILKPKEPTPVTYYSDKIMPRQSSSSHLLVCYSLSPAHIQTHYRP
jgi:hypothetical protein